VLNGGGEKQLRLSVTPFGMHLEPPGEGDDILISLKHLHQRGLQNIAYCVGSTKACRGALWTPATVNIFFDTTATD